MWKTCYHHAANDCLITVENCIFKTSLPFFKVFYQRLSHRANITASKITVEDNITPQAYHCQRQQGFPSGRYLAHCTFEIALSGAAILTLLLVCAFFSTQVQKYLAWVL